MARTVQDAKLDSRNARDKLKTRARPYYKMLIPGTLHLGYRRRRSGKGAQGRWLVRRYVGLDTKGIGRYRERDIGLADDFLDADGGTILNYAQAQQRALEWYPASDDGKKAPAGPLTVRDAIDRYLTALEHQRRSNTGQIAHSALTRFRTRRRSHDGAPPTMALRNRQAAAPSASKTWCCSAALQTNGRG